MKTREYSKGDITIQGYWDGDQWITKKVEIRIPEANTWIDITNIPDAKLDALVHEIAMDEYRNELASEAV